MAQPILSIIRERLKAAGASQWPGIAESASAAAGLAGDRRITSHSLRKLAYGDRDNPGMQHVQALCDHFGITAVEAGKPARKARAAA